MSSEQQQARQQALPQNCIFYSGCRCAQKQKHLRKASAQYGLVENALNLSCACVCVGVGEIDRQTERERENNTARVVVCESE